MRRQLAETKSNSKNRKQFKMQLHVNFRVCDIIVIRLNPSSNQFRSNHNSPSTLSLTHVLHRLKMHNFKQLTPTTPPPLPQPSQHHVGHSSGFSGDEFVQTFCRFPAGWMSHKEINYFYCIFVTSLMLQFDHKVIC